MKISTCDVKDIVLEEYSIELRNLVKNILSKEPEFRPSAKEILNHSMFKSREKYTTTVYN
jgi:serine/threonine protein kinase